MIKKRSYLLILILIISSLMMVAFMPSYSLASNPIEHPEDYKPGSITDIDAKPITDKANQIVGIIVTVGVIVSAVTIGILGIKYMIGSVEEKAEYKKSMIPYLVGAVLLFSTSSIVGLIAKLVGGTSLG